MKFLNLLKKELSELINKQMIFGLAATMIILALVGNIMKSTINDAVSENYTVNITDSDDTEFSHELIDMLKQNGVSVNLCESSTDDYSEMLSKADVNAMIIIPEGFSETLLSGSGTPAELISISSMEFSSVMSNMTNSNSSALTAIEACLRNMLAKQAGIGDSQLALMDTPVSVTENTVVAENSAEISIDSVMNKIMMQNMILPIVVFVLIMTTSQMLISAISNEKIDKTLETLLSAPVSRTSVLGAKMLTAAATALLNAAAYMFGFTFFISGAQGSIEETAVPAVGNFISVDEALSQLGLTLGVTDYILIGLQLFLTIMICLSVSLILGAMANDTKSSQNMVMPILMLAMVPYLISMLTDINTLPTVFRFIVYAIPFTHTFSAIPNLMFGNTTIFFSGLVYQLAVFAICMFFALRLFKSDKIFTISLNFGQKSKFRKNSSRNANE